MFVREPYARIYRIDNLVSKSVEKIWSGNHSWSSGPLNVNSITKYAIVIIVGGDGPTWEDYVVIPISGEKMNFQMGDFNGRTVHTIDTSTGVITYTGAYYGSAHENNKFHRIYGIK